MKTQLKSFGLLSAMLLGLTTGNLHAQLFPVTAGAVSTNVGAKLKFVNGTNYAASSGFALPLAYQRFANRYYTNFYYGTSNLLFQAISVKTNPATAAAFGSYLVCQIMSVTGPSGGVLTFWEQGAKWPTYEFPVNGAFVTGKNRIILSNVETGAGRSDGDPFGNLRGRRWSVNKAGEYLVTFRLYDTSENHPTTAAPIHLPSDPLTVKFKTDVVLNIAKLALSNGVSTVAFNQTGLTNLFVEASTNLAPGSWTVVDGPYTNFPTGTNLTVTLVTNAPSVSSMFFRLRAIAP
jgi:hypothetical protein